MKQREIDIFKIITKLACFTYIKDTYTDFCTSSFKKDDDVKKILSILKKLERHAHISNKDKIIEKAYDSVTECVDNSGLDEEKFFATIHDETKTFDKIEKTYILNSVIYLAYNDEKVTDEEKESILQIASFLELEVNYKKIISNYNKSEFGKSLSKLYIAIALVIFVAIISVSGYFIYIYKTDKIDSFDKKSFAFSEVFFNRYVIYKNAFEAGGEHFQKQAVFYLSGSADVVFDLKKSSLTYNPANNIVTYKYIGDFPFDLKPTFAPEVLVDEIKSKEISEEEAKTLGFAVGIVGGIGGAYAGGKASALISPFLPSHLKPVASLGGMALGGLAGSAVGYFVSSNMLEGAKLTDNISHKEKEEVIYAGKELILAVLKTNEEMVNMYKEQFAKYIKAKYARSGVDVVRVDFEQGDEK